MNNKILFIVEGERDKQHANKIAKSMNIKASIFNVKANIYMLYDKLLADNFQLNIADALLELNGVDDKDKEILRREAPFTYTYLFFDLDPHHSDNPKVHNMQVVSEMLNHFDNETDDTIGKLYINYPMIESLWDYDQRNLDEYATRFVSMQSVKKYKEIVGERGTPCNISKYDLKRYRLLALLNIKKANYIVNNIWGIPDYAVYLSDLTQKAIAVTEAKAVMSENKVYILNSFPLFMVDYWGKGFYESLTKKSE